MRLRPVVERTNSTSGLNNNLKMKTCVRSVTTIILILDTSWLERLQSKLQRQQLLRTDLPSPIGRLFNASVINSGLKWKDLKLNSELLPALEQVKWLRHWKVKEPKQKLNEPDTVVFYKNV